MGLSLISLKFVSIERMNGANYVPILNKQIRHFANKLDLLCKGKLDLQTNRKQL